MNNRQLKTFFVCLGVAIVLYLGFLGLVKTKPSETELVPPEMYPPEEGVACTMDARACPDGSFVGRIGPNCEFAPCPDGSQLQ